MIEDNKKFFGKIYKYLFLILMIIELGLWCFWYVFGRRYLEKSHKPKTS